LFWTILGYRTFWTLKNSGKCPHVIHFRSIGIYFCSDGI
jgi:hypothetical protein